MTPPSTQSTFSLALSLSRPAPMGRRALLAASLVIVSGAAVANDLRDENLLQSLPAGFEVGHQAKRDGLTMVERIPAGQSVNDWSEMVTTQISTATRRASTRFSAACAAGGRVLVMMQRRP